MEGRAEGLKKSGAGRRGRRGSSNGVFVLVGVTHKALAGQHSLVTVTKHRE